MTCSLQQLSSPRNVRGISLIEVMVSVLVLAVGLLGIAAMQSFALRGGQGSLESSQAVMQTGSIFEMMRANSGVDYTLAKTCAASSVTGTSLVKNDQRAWIQALKSTMGDVATTCGEIACAPATTRICTITVHWDDSRAGGGTGRKTETSAVI